MFVDLAIRFQPHQLPAAAAAAAAAAVGGGGGTTMTIQGVLRVRAAKIAAGGGVGEGGAEQVLTVPIAGLALW